MTMDKVTFIEVESMGVTETHAIIDRGNGEFTSMTKAHYDELQKQADQPIGGNK
jgi:hypothetical protein